MGLFRDDAEIKVISPLSPAECMLRFRERKDPFWKIWGQPVIINFKGDAAAFLEKRRFFGGLFPAILKVKIVVNDNGALVLCRLGISTSMKIMAGIWLSILLLFGLPLFVEGLRRMVFSDAPLYSEGLVFVLAPTSLFIFATAQYVLAKYFYRKDKDYLIDFVRRTVGGYGIDL